jgi:hypothetical protein
VLQHANSGIDGVKGQQAGRREQPFARPNTGENAMTVSAVQQLIADARIPGLSMAVIQDRQATALTVVGVRNAIDCRERG